eukprot:Awhi_evm1s8527
MGKTCRACKQGGLPDEMVPVCGDHWHPKCFKCIICNNRLTEDNAYLVRGRLFCYNDTPRQGQRFRPSLFDKICPCLSARNNQTSEDR